MRTLAKCKLAGLSACDCAAHRPQQLVKPDATGHRSEAVMSLCARLQPLACAWAQSKASTLWRAFSGSPQHRGRLSSAQEALCMQMMA